MLKRFIVENFSSFRDETILELTAGRTELHPNHLFEYTHQKVKILKSAIIYGANASGKSNLIKAIEFAKMIIIKGFNETETYKKYFRLDKDSKNRATQFEFEMEINNHFYSYGFSSFLNQRVIEEEWLYEIGKSSDELIFERKKNEIKLGNLLQKNKKLKERFKIYIEDMGNQPSQLFLSEISNKNLDNSTIETFNDIYNWFNEKLVILHPNTKYGNISSIGSDDNLSKIFKKYLKNFDTGIVDIISIEEDFEENFKKFPTEFKIDIEKDIENSKNKKIILRGSDGLFATIYKDETNELKIQKLGLIHSEDFNNIFELQDESDGTKRLFNL